MLPIGSTENYLDNAPVTNVNRFFSVGGRFAAPKAEWRFFLGHEGLWPRETGM